MSAGRNIRIGLDDLVTELELYVKVSESEEAAKVLVKVLEARSQWLAMFASHQSRACKYCNGAACGVL